MDRKPNILITGAAGYIGSIVCKQIADSRDEFGTVVGLDLREPSADRKFSEISYIADDIRSKKIGDYLRKHQIDVVVHLAAIVSPAKSMSRDFLHDVEVNGTRNLLDACVAANVRQFIVTSSGAAYGYHPDNPDWLDETAPLRGNPEFAYSDHKRQIEEMLAEFRAKHPQLRQLIFRPGTILGANVNNQITDLFKKPVVLGLRGADSPFVFIWDEDVAAVILDGIRNGKSGIFNLAGDGTLSMPEIAKILGKPYVSLPVSLVKSVLSALKILNLTQYGPEQVNFIRYRPVLDNQHLKSEFGYIPQKTSREVFEYFLANR